MPERLRILKNHNKKIDNQLQKVIPFVVWYMSQASARGQPFSIAMELTIHSQAKVSKIVPIWLSFVVNLVPNQSECSMGIQRPSKHVA